ncbi:MAG: amidohydrolase family protein, partial [Kiritimatiellaeota bacterium]|nr:amidohydrolase family protein [Kiritimatiellota bacterium]
MPELDLLLLNATLHDGTGAPPRVCGVGVAGGRVAAIGAPANAGARERLDLRRLVLAPGFIDAHSHSDTHILVDPNAFSKITQGVTTEICGQCGASAAPLFGGAALPSDWVAANPPGAWQAVAQYRAALEAVRPAVNIALFAGHNTLRKGVMGYAPRAATTDELALMARRLEAALDEGAAGLSTGLLYEPGPHATPEEILTLARVAAKHGGVYATHMRSEGAKLLEALDEAIGLAEEAGVALQISHLKTASPENAWKLAPALDKIHAAQERGVRVHADRYPYLAGSTDLDVLLPAW